MQALGGILVFLIRIYLFMISARVIISWIHMPPNTFVKWICKFTDPVLDYFRKNYPIKLFMFDVSIIIPIGILVFLERFITETAVRGNPLTPQLIIGLLLLLVNIAVSIIAFALFITSIILAMAGNKAGYMNNPMLIAIKKVYNPVIKVLRDIFNIRGPNSERTYYIIIAIIIAFLGIFVTSVINGIAYSLIHYGAKEAADAINTME